jgi:predicted transcriptional regulator
MCKIKEILRKKGPHFNVVSPNTKVLDALTLMQSENYSYVVVMDNESYLGIMSERDYIHKVKVLGNKQDSASVKEILDGNLPVVNFEENLNRCMVLMNVYKTRYLPVFDQLEFKGVLTMTDLMTEILEEKKYDLL